jgi:hypothetical protein
MGKWLRCFICVPSAAPDGDIQDVEDASLNLDGGIGGLIENSPHVAIALRRAVALGHARFLYLRAMHHPMRELLGGRKNRCHRTGFGHDLVCGVEV